MGVDRQECRRVEHLKMKAEGKLGKAVVSVKLDCRGSVGSTSEVSYHVDHHHPQPEPCILQAPSPASDAAGYQITGKTSAELLVNAKKIINNNVVEQLLVELCCSGESQLSGLVPPRAAAIRVTAELDFTSDKTYRVIRDIVTMACKKGIRVITWAAVPCTAGCPWKHINKKMGRATGDAVLTNNLIRNAVKLCKYTERQGGDFCWEWPSRCDLWFDERVFELVQESAGELCEVSTSAAGLFLRERRSDGARQEEVDCLRDRSGSREGLRHGRERHGDRGQYFRGVPWTHREGERELSTKIC